MNLQITLWSYPELRGATWSYLELRGATWSYLELRGSLHGPGYDISRDREKIVVMGCHGVVSGIAKQTLQILQGNT